MLVEEIPVEFTYFTALVDETWVLNSRDNNYGHDAA